MGTGYMRFLSDVGAAHGDELTPLKRPQHSR